MSGYQCRDKEERENDVGERYLYLVGKPIGIKDTIFSPG